MKSEDCKKYAAELIGTAALVLIGCGSAVIASKAGVLPSIPGVGLLGIAFAFGLTVLVMVYAIGNISGCHINPASLVISRSCVSRISRTMVTVPAFVGTRVLLR